MSSPPTLAVMAAWKKFCQQDRQRRTVHGDYIINMCLNREGFLAIISYKDQNMLVVVEGRRPICWACKQLGNFA